MHTSRGAGRRVNRKIPMQIFPTPPIMQRISKNPAEPHMADVGNLHMLQLYARPLLEPVPNSPTRVPDES